ncbi:MAG TPA: sigma-70 family RNA polymerase sigma factor [Vicinamibacterales bacterium]
MSDDEIVQRVVAGDTALFETLMRRHHQRLYRTVRAIVRNESAVEDVMQQAYANAYRHLAQFEGRARFSTWLSRIAVNEAIATLERGAHVFPLDSTQTADAIADPRTDPERELFSLELQGLLAIAIRNLPATCRVVFVLREVEGLSTAETAACLAIRSDAVKTRLRRARLRLRQHLASRLGATGVAAGLL